MADEGGFSIVNHKIVLNINFAYGIIYANKDTATVSAGHCSTINYSTALHPPPPNALSIYYRHYRVSDVSPNALYNFILQVILLVDRQLFILIWPAQKSGFLNVYPHQRYIINNCSSQLASITSSDIELYGLEVHAPLLAI